MTDLFDLVLAVIVLVFALPTLVIGISQLGVVEGADWGVGVGGLGSIISIIVIVKFIEN